MRNKPSLQDISNKLDDFSILLNDFAAISCNECSADLDASNDEFYCSDCTEADRDKIEELKKENEELREKLEKADWSDKMDLLHEWALDIDSYEYRLQQAETVRTYWYSKHTALFNKMMSLQDEIKKLVNNGY